MALAAHETRLMRPRILRKDRTGATPFVVGAVDARRDPRALLLRLHEGQPVHAATSSSRPSSRPRTTSASNSPVRIAGVNVGHVVKVEGQDGTNNAVVTMEVKDTGLPIHKDATLKIRPRILLEGNFFVDLEPGTPAAPTISDGDTIPVVADGGAGADRPALHRAPEGHAQEPADHAQGARRGARRTSRRPRRTPTSRSTRKGKTAAQALNSAVDLRRSRRCATRRSSRRRCSASERDDLTGLIRAVGADRRGARPARAAGRGAGRELQHDDGGASPTSRQPLQRGRRRARADGARRPTSARRARTTACRRSARSRARSDPGRRSRRSRRSTPSRPWIAQGASRSSARSELGGLLDDLVPATASLALATVARRSRSIQQRRPARQVLHAT